MTKWNAEVQYDVPIILMRIVVCNVVMMLRFQEVVVWEPLSSAVGQQILL